MSPTTPAQPPAGWPNAHRLGRRQLLQLGLAGTAGTLAAVALGGCGQGTRQNLRGQLPEEGDPTTSVQTSNDPTAAASPKVLVAYFSRAGENYYYGDRTWLEVGNTEVVARMIADLIPCDLHRIEAAKPYPDDYDETVERNVREQDTDARPAIANPPPTIDEYDVVLLGSPIWNVRAPMIMSTFAENHDFTGKTVHPFTTYAMSGLGTTERDYAETCTGATLGEGLAVRGEEAHAARPMITEWLRRSGLIHKR
jgi:flavodoxin